MKKRILLLIFFLGMTGIALVLGLFRRFHSEHLVFNFSRQWGPIQTVPKTTDKTGMDSILLGGGGGENLVAMWTYFDYQNHYIGSGSVASSIIFTASFSPQSGSWSEPMLNETFEFSTKPQLAFDDSGNGILVYVKDRQMWVKHYDPKTGWGTPHSLSEGLEGRVLGDYPISGTVIWEPVQLRVAANGDAVLLWMQYMGTSFDTQPLNLQLYVASYSAEEGKWVGRQMLSKHTLDEKSVATIALNGQGQALIAWNEQDPQSGGEKISSVLCPKVKLPCQTLQSFDVNHPKGESAHGISILETRSGEFAVLWVSANRGRETSVLRYQTYNGDRWSEPEIASKEGEILPWTLQSQNSANGGMVSWVLSNNFQDKIFVMNSKPNGGLGKAQAIASFGRDDLKGIPSLRMDQEGNALIVWAQHTAFLETSILSMSYSPKSGWSEKPFDLSNSKVLDNDEATAVMMPQGKAAVLWIQGREGSQDIVSRSSNLSQ